MGEDRIVSSKEEVAAHVGKSWRTVYRWIKDGLPVRPDGTFDLDQVDEWVIRRRGGGGSGSTRGGSDRSSQEAVLPGDDKDFWDKESKKEQALKRRLDRLKTEKELIELRLVEDMFVARIIEVKTLFLSFERLLTPELMRCRTYGEMADMIRKHTNRALHQFSRPLPPNMRPPDATVASK